MAVLALKIAFFLEANRLQNCSFAWPYFSFQCEKFEFLNSKHILDLCIWLTIWWISYSVWDIQPRMLSPTKLCTPWQWRYFQFHCTIIFLYMALLFCLVIQCLVKDMKTWLIVWSHVIIQGSRDICSLIRPKWFDVMHDVKLLYEGCSCFITCCCMIGGCPTDDLFTSLLRQTVHVFVSFIK